MGMNCGRANRLMSAYIDGELPGTDMLDVRSHLRSCQACEQEYESLRRVKTAMSHLQLVRASAGAEDRLIALLRAEATPAGARIRQWLGSHVFGRVQPAALAVYACAALLLVALGHLPDAVQWSDNYTRHQMSATVEPVSFGGVKPEPIAAPAVVRVANIGQDFEPARLDGAVVSNAFAPNTEPVLTFVDWKGR